MQQQISNGLLSATISTKGAELCSLKNKSGKEFMWQADPDFWSRHAPVLFPFVGRLKNDSYIYNGKNYNCGQHGFARDCNFNLISFEEDSCTFELPADASTLQKFPFRFSLQTIYRLDANSLSIKHVVKNNDTKQMPFSIGAHPAFVCPFEKDELFEDYFLEFEKPESLQSLVLNDGLFEDEQFSDLQNEKVLRLNYKTFKLIDTYVFRNLKSDWVELKSAKTKTAVRVSIKGFPFLGVWTKSDAPFLCIEPWFGLADFKNHDGNLLNKKGIQLLNTGETFECEYAIEIF